MNLHLLLCATTIALANSSHAQNVAPFWSAVGNSNATAASKLGTTNAIPLSLYTGNVARLYINPSGNIGIGTVNPIYKLHVDAGAGTAAVYGKTTGNFAVYGAGGKYGVYGAGVYGVAGSGSSYGVQGTSPNGYGVQGSSTNAYGGQFTSTNSYGVYVTGKTIGLYSYGTTYALYGSGGNYGVYGSGTAAGVYGSAYTFNMSGVYGNGTSAFGVQGNSSGNYGGYFTSTNLHGLYAKTLNTNPAAYAAIFQGNTYSYGAYQTSDERVKKNITEFKNEMAVINQLQPKAYEFATEGKLANLNLPKGNHYGFLAADVEKLFPGLVREAPLEVQDPQKVVDQKPNSSAPGTPDVVQIPSAPKIETMQVKAINYTELIPIIIKGMQEVDAENKELKQQIAELKDELQQLKLKVTGQITTASLSDASLLQNQPNPFGASTIIPLNVPESASRALLTITEAGSGKVIKMQNVPPGSKQVIFDGSFLASGTYMYTLTIGGKKISRKMTVAK